MGNRLRELLPKGREIRVRQVERDKYGRLVAELFIANRSVNLQMVKEIVTDGCFI